MRLEFGFSLLNGGYLTVITHITADQFWELADCFAVMEEGGIWTLPDWLAIWGERTGFIYT